MKPNKPDMDFSQYYYLDIAAAYIRGQLDRHRQSGGAREKPLTDLTPLECTDLFQQGADAGLRLHRFKRSSQLPRVKKTLGILKSLQPMNLLDIGTGRGVFLWPLIEAFPYLSVTCIDMLFHRVADIRLVQAGGIDNLHALQMSAGALAFGDRAFDGVTLLETLEHVAEPGDVVREVCRVADRFVVVSVPSKPDDNPGHLHLFTAQDLTSLFNAAGFTRVKRHAVLNHMVALAMR